MNKKKALHVTALLILLPLLLSFCSKRHADVNLSPGQSTFISEVRYLITKAEKKEFYSLGTEEERDRFIEEFWQQRDPDPVTDGNEFKDSYYDRIDEANHLFRDGGKRGWLCDRGRVHILLGPPDHRRYHPGVINVKGTYKKWYEHPHETWYYGYYPIYFVDSLENGTFDLRVVSARNLTTILQTSLQLKPGRLDGKAKKAGKAPYQFSAKARKVDDGKIELDVKVPYKNILFRQEDETFNATLSINVEVTC
ncbi:MAG: GWxTD domain-containing protein, partial [bacterium]|nr:GWxTD domain-containing protein [bacterium]